MGFPGQAVRRLPVALCLGAALAFTASFIWVALRRMGYPYELEWMEGAILLHVQRVLDGLPIYAAPSLDFTPFIYSPLYYYLAAPGESLFAGFLPLRLLSFLCALGTLAVLYLWVREKTGSPVAAGLGAGFQAAGFGATGFWHDLARVDSLFILLLMAGLWRLDGPAKPSRMLASALLLVAAFHCKQSALLAIACVAPLYLGRGRKPFLLCSAALAMGIPGSIWILDRIHDGWYSFYLFGLPSRHGILSSMWTGFWTRDTLAVFPLAFLLGGAAAAGRFRMGNARGTLFLAAGSAGMLGASWASRLHVGGWDNVLMPAFAWLSLLAGLGIGALERYFAARISERPGVVSEPERPGPDRIGILRAGFYAVVLLQFARFGYDPRKQVPDASDLEAGRRVDAWIRETPGDVLIPDHGYLARKAGKPAFAHRIALEDLLRGSPDSVRAPVQRQLETALRDGRFSAILSDYENPEDAGIFPEAAFSRYRLTGSLDFETREFMPRTGIKSRPAYIFKPSGIPGT